MQRLVRFLVYAALISALDVACTMQQTNHLPIDDGPPKNAVEIKPPKPAPGDSSTSNSLPGDPSPGDAAPVPSIPPPDASTAPTGLAVANFTLINADTDQPIANFDPMTEGVTVVLGMLPTQNLNIRANTTSANGEVIGSVLFGLDGDANFHIEGAAPYALGADSAGDYAPLTPPLAVGNHTLTAAPYSGANATGNKGASNTLNFTLQ